MAKKDAVESTEMAVAEKPTAEMILAESNFLALRPDSELREAMEANYAEGETLKFGDLIRASVPSGGATKWTIPTLEGDVQLDEIVGACVYYKPSGTLWPSFDPIEGEPPLLRTRDLKVAERVGDDYGDLNPDVLEEARLLDEAGQPCSTPDGRELYDWQKLAYNAWGSGKDGIGKRCKETRLMCLLQEDQMFPLFIQIPTGSIKPVTRFTRLLTRPTWNYVFGLSLVKEKSSGGITYSQIKPRLVKTLDPAEVAALKRTYTDTLDGAVDQIVTEDAGGEDVPF